MNFEERRRFRAEEHARLAAAEKDQRIFDLEVAQDRLTAERDRALDRVRVLELTAAMSDSMAVGPHDFDEHLRICKRCGASTQEWVDGKAECGTGDLDLTGWEGATPQEKHDRRARNIAQAAARQERGKTAAADDFAHIRQRQMEIEKADEAARVGQVPVFWLPSRTHEEDVTVPLDFSTDDLAVKATESFGYVPWSVRNGFRDES